MAPRPEARSASRQALVISRAAHVHLHHAVPGGNIDLVAGAAARVGHRGVVDRAVRAAGRRWPAARSGAPSPDRRVQLQRQHGEAALRRPPRRRARARPARRPWRRRRRPARSLRRRPVPGRARRRSPARAGRPAGLVGGVRHGWRLRWRAAAHGDRLLRDFLFGASAQQAAHAGDADVVLVQRLVVARVRRQRLQHHAVLLQRPSAGARGGCGRGSAASRCQPCTWRVRQKKTMVLGIHRGGDADDAEGAAGADLALIGMDRRSHSAPVSPNSTQSKFTPRWPVSRRPCRARFRPPASRPTSRRWPSSARLRAGRHRASGP